MTGLLLSQGLRISQSRVGTALRSTNPSYHLQRCSSAADEINPVPYSAEYFQHKLHVSLASQTLTCGERVWQTAYSKVVLYSTQNRVVKECDNEVWFS